MRVIKPSLSLVVLLALPLWAQAEDVRQRALRTINESMTTQHNICVTKARIALLPSEKNAPNDVADCAAEGKSEVEETAARLTRLVKGNAPQAALAAWRVQWLAAFDDAALQASDTSATYLRRTTAAIKGTEKAAQKLEASVLKSPM